MAAEDKPKEKPADDKPAAPKAEKKPEKKSIPAWVWWAVLFVVSVGVGLIVLFTEGGILIAMAIDSFNTACLSILRSLVGTSEMLKYAAHVIRSFATGVSAIFNSAATVLIIPVFWALAIWVAWSATRPKKD
jgi:hypothetical protein